MTDRVPRRLKPVSRPAREALRYTCQVAAQANFAGTQDTRVQAATPLAEPGRGYIAVRIGKMLIYVEDRDALESCVSARQEASTYADQAFGPVLPPPVYQPRG